MVKIKFLQCWIAFWLYSKILTSVWIIIEAINRKFIGKDLQFKVTDLQGKTIDPYQIILTRLQIRRRRITLSDTVYLVPLSASINETPVIYTSCNVLIGISKPNLSDLYISLNTY